MMPLNAVDVGGSSGFVNFSFWPCFLALESLRGAEYTIFLFCFSQSLSCFAWCCKSVWNSASRSFLCFSSRLFSIQLMHRIYSFQFSFLSFSHAVALTLRFFLLASLEVIIPLCYPRIPAEGKRGVACVWDYRLEWLSSPAVLLSLSPSPSPPCFSLSLLGILQMWSS